PPRVVVGSWGAFHKELAPLAGVKLFQQAKALGLSALVGCGGGGGSPTAPASSSNSDLDAVTAALASATHLFDDGLYDITSSTGASARAAGTFAAMEPAAFHRSVSRSSQGFAIALSDSDEAGRPHTADVTINRSTLGMFMVVRRPAGGGAVDTGDVVHKVMDDRWTRHVRLVRRTVLTPDGAREQWQLDQMSALKIVSQPCSRAIVSLHLTGSGLDATITDPAALRTFAQLPQAALGDSVTITTDAGANTGANAGNDVFVYWGDRRVRMTPNGDGTHTVRVHSGSLAGVRSLGVNVFSRGTLHDDALIYDSVAWIVPLTVGTPVPSVWP
ncbi:MAG: hypothetical protein ABL977_15405, partial [Candidatus Eisenbacteria bacterium]